jgi:threonine dehydratase
VVGDEDIAEAIVRLLERAKLVVEGAGAVGVAGLMVGTVAPAATGATVVVLSGGNIDAGLLAAVARRHETAAGRRMRMVGRGRVRMQARIVLKDGRVVRRKRLTAH